MLQLSRQEHEKQNFQATHYNSFSDNSLQSQEKCIEIIHPKKSFAKLYKRCTISQKVRHFASSSQMQKQAHFCCDGVFYVVDYHPAATCKAPSPFGRGGVVPVGSRRPIKRVSHSLDMKSCNIHQNSVMTEANRASAAAGCCPMR